MATAFAGASLLPLTLGLGAAIFVTFEHLFSRSVGIAAGASFAIVALLLLYGLGLAMRKKKGQPMQDQATDVSLKSRIEQMLTEARVIVPGAPGAARLPVDRGANQGVQRTALRLQICSLHWRQRRR